MSEDFDFLGEDAIDDVVIPDPANVEDVEDRKAEKPIEINASDKMKSESSELGELEGEFFPVGSKNTDTIEMSNTVDPLDPLSVMGIDRREYPHLIGDDYPQPYTAISDGIIIQYSKLPKLNQGDIYAELSCLSVKSCPTPTLQVINDEIQKVQSAKDRLSEIYCDVLQNYHFKKRAVDILEAAWSKYTLEKNAEKRKGDSLFRISEFSIDFAKVESLAKVCQHILKNLDSLHESLSRRITVNQLLLKLNDMGRGSLPMSDFSSRPLDDLIGGTLDSDDNKKDENPEELEEMSF